MFLEFKINTEINIQINIYTQFWTKNSVNIKCTRLTILDQKHSVNITCTRLFFPMLNFSSTLWPKTCKPFLKGSKELNYCTPFLKGLVVFHTLSQRLGAGFPRPFPKGGLHPFSKVKAQGFLKAPFPKVGLYPFSKVCFLILVEASHRIHKCLELWNTSLVSPPVPVPGLPDGVHLDALAGSLLQDVCSIIKHDGAAM